jgi:hypothetical protein
VKDKAEILLQVDESQSIKNELTIQVKKYGVYMIDFLMLFFSLKFLNLTKQNYNPSTLQESNRNYTLLLCNSKLVKIPFIVLKGGRYVLKNGETF